MLEVWLLSSLIVVNMWTSSTVKHFSLCQGLSVHTATESTLECTDRLCLITENSAGKVHKKSLEAQCQLCGKCSDSCILDSSFYGLVILLTITNY